MLNIKPEDTPLYALFFSFLSLIVSGLSFRNSSKSLAIAKKDFENRSKSISVYLVDSKRIRISNKQEFIAFNLTYTNESTNPETLHKIELAIQYTDGNNPSRETYSHVVKKAPAIIKDMSFLSDPVNISGRSAVSSWFLFKISESLISKDIRLYKIIAETSQGNFISTQAHIFYNTKTYDEDS